MNNFTFKNGRVYQIMNRKTLMVLLLLIISCFIISCVNNKGESSKVVDGTVPEPLVPTIVQQGTTITEGSGSAEGSGAGHEVVNPDYSPGNVDWKLPTQEEQDKWDHDVYIVALEKWAQPRLDNWTCQSCKEKLGQNFNFKSRDGNNIKFECRCSCGHTHIVTLQGSQ